MARNGFRPFWAAKLVIRTPDSAITMPLDRSMPVVRMTSVWPIASTPTTITCCRIREKLGPERNRAAHHGEEDAGHQQRRDRAEDGRSEQDLDDAGGAGRCHCALR